MIGRRYSESRIQRGHLTGLLDRSRRHETARFMWGPGVQHTVQPGCFAGLVCFWKQQRHERRMLRGRQWIQVWHLFRRRTLVST